MIIGIDIGGSTTKIVGFENNQIIDYLTVKASDPIASATGALGKFVNKHELSLNTIDKLLVTGAGSSYIKNNLFGIQTIKVDEFKAIGLGGIYLTGLDKAIVVSMGTGTAIVRADGTNITHLGGTGVGGGTLLGLSKCIFNAADFDNITEMAKLGELRNVDLSIGDISQSHIGSLPNTVTASNFGKLSEKATKEDYALGVINLVFQTIGVISTFAARINNDKDIVLTGKLIKVPQAKIIFERLSVLFGVNFHLPENADYSTAIGAAISN